MKRRQATFHTPTLSWRDQQTLEVRQFYPLPHAAEEPCAYALDAYFFFPRSFGITPQNWNREVFYRNTNILTRIHAPELSLRALTDLNRTDNPAGALQSRIDGLIADRHVNGAAMTALAQMFGAELADVVRTESDAVQGALRSLASPHDIEALARDIEQLCDLCLAATSVLRRVRAKAQAFQGVAPPQLLPSLAFAEEYSSAIIDESLSQLAVAVGDAEALYDGRLTAARLRLGIANTLEDLNARRRVQGFVAPHQRDAEYYSYRLGLLKKELQRSLYVNTRTLSADPFYANTAAAVAAGLAATWAMVAQIPLVTASLSRDSSEGLILASGLGVAAYILKDRIKDLVKQRLMRRWSQWDHDIQVQGDTLAAVGLGSFAGRARERFKWEDEGSIPDEVAALRRRTRTVRGASTELEQVFHYRRWLSLTSNASSPLPHGYGLEEIFRLSISDILHRLDDPNRRVTFY
ncbi:MAG TPA: hypothetical protein VFH51_09915, partial [Myxococcota bacterium]|nr:hypothetical protein [Myxococcota bacterium]